MPRRLDPAQPMTWADFMRQAHERPLPREVLDEVERLEQYARDALASGAAAIEASADALVVHDQLTGYDAATPPRTSGGVAADSRGRRHADVRADSYRDNQRKVERLIRP